MPTLGHRLKRWLYIVHRWIGIASCLFFAMWFGSGLVMIYVPYPTLTRAEKLAGLPAIDWPLVRASPSQALRAAGIDVPPRDMVLEMRASRPVWRITPDAGSETDVSAVDGVRLSDADAAEAREAATLFSRRAVTGVEWNTRDQWTVAGGYDRHRPLWKATLAGPGGHVLYVSSKTGAVVLDTSAHERFWNWLGSVPHWLYPTVLRQDNAAWRQVVMWVSGPCIVAAITGFWIGVLRTRIGRRRYRLGRLTPYRGWMEWHHWAGLIGGVALIAWIFSGWLSVDPFRLFASGGITATARSDYARATLPPPIDLERLGVIAHGAKQVELRWLSAHPLLAIRHEHATLVLDAATLGLAPHPIIDPGRLLPGAPILSIDRLTAPDAYWYEVGAPPQLPVLRVRFDDPARTWVHIDPATGAVLGDITARGRIYRWLFDLLHKWDLNLLTLHRPAWDLLLWLLSLFGIVTSVSGVWIGWRRLTRCSRERPAASLPLARGPNSP